MFRTVALICSLGSDPSTCTKETALDVVPGPVASMQQCLFGGQTQVATTAIRPEPGKSYMRVLCEPIRTVER